MKLSKKSIVRKGATLALMTAMVFGSAVPAFAEDIEQGVTAGALTAVISAAPTFTSKTTSHAAQNSDSSTVVLTADDLRGQASPAGWDVSMISTLLTSGALTIPATAVSVQSVGTIASTNGLLTAVSNGAAVGALDTARVMMTATAANGVGTYTEDVTLRIVLPANVKVGTYSGTLTTTIATK